MLDVSSSKVKKNIPEHRLGPIWKVNINCDQIESFCKKKKKKKKKKSKNKCSFPVHALYALKKGNIGPYSWKRNNFNLPLFQK